MFNASEFNFKGNWIEVKGKLKEKYAQLTDNDLLLVDGEEEKLYERLQVRLDKSKEELRAEIEKY